MTDYIVAGMIAIAIGSIVGLIIFKIWQKGNF